MWGPEGTLGQPDQQSGRNTEPQPRKSTLHPGGCAQCMNTNGSPTSSNHNAMGPEGEAGALHHGPARSLGPGLRETAGIDVVGRIMGPHVHQSGELVDLKNVCKLRVPAGLRGLSDITKWLPLYFRLPTFTHRFLV